MFAHPRKQVVIPPAREDAGRNPLHKAAKDEAIVIIHIIDHGKVEVYVWNTVEREHLTDPSETLKRLPAATREIESFHRIKRRFQRSAGCNQRAQASLRNIAEAKLRRERGELMLVFFADGVQQPLTLRVTDWLLRQHAGEHTDI
ncbi:hypothetical protein SDC9_171786 [bioreactor metagenome]|uniref:Uncharacterized protein n=1 Tax=bioreactor metagenome TaxID=1076179 RepID=A0A645GBT6_9ZZZZ